MKTVIVNEQYLREVLEFIKKCDKDFFNKQFLLDNATIANEYLINLKKLNKEDESSIYYAITEKLSFIINQIHTYNFHNYNKDSVLNLVSVSVTDYIIKLVKEKHITESILISRFVYIELSKVLYYDISYINQDKEQQKLICNAQVDYEKEKIFSYVVCTQFVALYKYILDQFGIQVDIKTKTGQDHVWGEIRLSEKNILIVDATGYIKGSIDLCNAKANNPTVGFVILPAQYSGIRIHDVFNNPNYNDVKEKIKKSYQYNRELDMTLGYIGKDGYKTEQIIKENDLFSHSDEILSGKQNISDYLEKVIDFFRTVKIPNNIDGYEIFAFYQKFINSLPTTISSNITQKTIYVNAYDYKMNKMRKKFFHVPNEYLKYLQELLYNRYYKYLSEEEYNIFLEQVKTGTMNVIELGNSIATYEMKIAEINRKLNLYYAINKLSIFDPFEGEEKSIQLYEPMMGRRFFNSIEEYEKFEFKLKK